MDVCLLSVGNGMVMRSLSMWRLIEKKNNSVSDVLNLKGQ